MNDITKKKLICLINIFNSAAKLTTYDVNPRAVNILDTATEMLKPYQKYWTLVDPKIGVVKLKKTYRKEC